MALVLGIDAAWSEKNPSGVALVKADVDRHRLIQVGPSFVDFVNRTPPEYWGEKPTSSATVHEALSKANEFGGEAVSVIAVDMPIAHSRVRRRRTCDNEISQAFGQYQCSTYTPNDLRPGAVSDRFLDEATAAGFKLQTCSSRRDRGPALLEVYPHVALLKLFEGADHRLPNKLPYKLAKRKTNWPTFNPRDGREAIKREWDRILARLKSKIDMDLEIDCAGKTLRCWKAWEDVIDAIVCCWVGLEWLADAAEPYGDEDAAIWVPVASGGGE